MNGAPGAAIAHAALLLVGAPFKMHGRIPAVGLDCVGVVLESLRMAGVPAPAIPPYALRNGDDGPFIMAANLAGFQQISTQPKPGDILMVRPGPAQMHLLICAADGDLVHAHAGLRRVVLTPAPCPWPICANFRYDMKD